MTNRAKNQKVRRLFGDRTGRKNLDGEKGFLNKQHHEVIMEQDIIDSEAARKASITELVQKLLSSEKRLSGSEAEERLRKYG